MKDVMLNGIGPWIFASVAFIGIMIVVLKQQATINRHQQEMRDEMKEELREVKGSLMEIAKYMQGLMVLSQNIQHNDGKRG